ncbi:MAG TPA: CopD family protein, partial [Ilumatobacteraceae bacterium]|nr:CopD family protein [Ilumatobacteraceae bacterium]
SAAFETDAGAAFAVRISLVAALAWVVFMAKRSDEWRWSLSSLLLLGLLATWAYAGHSRSMRWPVLGVPLDVAHHAAAAAWIGGLAIIGLIAVRESDLDELSQIVNRFAKVAATSVAVIVATGVLQAIRLVGSPTQLLAADHGKYLLVKVLVLGAMLKVADINRQRVSRRFNSNGVTTPRVVENLRRAMGTELAVGLMVIGVTAALVVSPPAVSQEPTPSAAAEGLSPSTSTSVAAVTLPSVLITVPLSGCVLSGTALQIGSAGADVACLHQALKAIGLIDNQTSDTFDTKTDAAVRALQAQRGLVVDGIVGRVTASELGIWPS